ncbi:MAG: Crp/Fnr family transcriptional regulator [Hyphomicrobiales bacterium]|nr:Crp/Fnr family transcriptional regulator [Hyphomicrobiales bacterium]
MPRMENETRADTKRERVGRCFPNDILERSEWRVLGPEELAELCAKALCRAYQPGETVFYEGDACRGVYFISEGLVGVRKEDPEGNSVLLHLATDGDSLGYRPFLAGDSHRASAEVLRTSKICFFDADSMRTLLRDNPDLGIEFLRRATRELGIAENRFYEAVRLNLRTRVAHLLLLFKDRYATVEADGRILLDLPISRQDMAAMIGVRAESLSRTIRTLADDGLIDVSGHRAWILDMDRLIAEVAPLDVH